MGKKLTKEEAEQLIGMKKDKLTVIEYLGFYAKEDSDRKRHYYLCQCDCGNTCIVRQKVLTDKKRKTASCGCNVTLHKGISKHPAYQAYKCMIGRVKRPHPYYHKHYIENHIGICEEWDGHPENFYKWADENGFRKGLSLDRIDNTKDYSPDNCRWADAYTQANNRGSYNHNLTYNGKTQSISMWARELNIRESTLRARIDSGMSTEEALTKPVDMRYSRYKNLDKKG